MYSVKHPKTSNLTREAMIQPEIKNNSKLHLTQFLFLCFRSLEQKKSMFPEASHKLKLEGILIPV